MKKIAIIDDYEESCQLLTEILSSAFLCASTADPLKALELVKEFKPDLILLDYKMPGLMGVDICKLIRNNPTSTKTPIIFISGAANVDDRILAFETGADDFIAKPFHVKELVLRINARLNEVKNQNRVVEMAVSNLKINLASRQVYVEGEEISLTPKQFDILRILVESKNHLVTREKCLEEIWGGTEVTSRNVDSQINYLKRKIGKFNGKITAIPSLGYRLDVN